MASLNDIVLQLQLVRDQAPAGMVPVQASMYLAIAFGRPVAEVCADQDIISCPTFLDHATFIRTVRRLLPLDENGTRSEYTGSAPREDLSGLLKTFGRDAVEVDRFMSENVPEQQVGLNKFLRILAKPIAGQRYPIGIYTVSRPLDGAPTKSYALTQPSSTVRSRGRERTKAALGISVQRDAVTLALARRLRYTKYRNSLQRQRARRSSDATDSSSDDREVNVLTFRLCGLEL